MYRIPRYLNILALILLSPLSFANVPLTASQLLHHSYPSTILGRAYHYNLYLPKGYVADGSRHYPVVYALHGSGGDEDNWVIKGRSENPQTNIITELDRLIDEHKIQPMIVVFPGAYQSWWVDGHQEPAMKALMTEFIPMIEAKWYGIKARKGRALVGLSMGAYGALNLALRYPEVFSAAGLLSPSVFDAQDPLILTNNVSKHPAFLKDGVFDVALYEQNDYRNFLPTYRTQAHKVAFYISSGDRDQFNLAKVAFELFETLKMFQLEKTALHIIPETSHEWKAWNEEVGAALQYIAPFISLPLTP